MGPEVAGLSGRTILAVFAHPDDESLACGGTLARLADAGARVTLICASHGECGGRNGPLCDDELGHRRTSELRDAAAALGLSDVIIFDHPDGALRWSDITVLEAEITITIKRHRPAAVITFGADGLYWHPDHIGVHERTTSALRALGAGAPALYYVTMPSGAMRPIVDEAMARGWTPPAHGFWSLTPEAFGVGAERPTVVVDVTEWVPRKLAAIRCHGSQIASDDPFGQMDEPTARRWLGVEHFHRARFETAGEPILELLDTYAQ